MTMKMRAAALLAVSVTFSLGMSEAYAAPSQKDRREAQQLAHEAKKLVTQGDLKGATKKYKRADQLVPSVTYKLAVGKAYADLGDYVQAATALREAAAVTGAVGPEKRALEEAKKLLVAIDAKTPKLEFEMMQPEASKVTLLVDEEEVDPTSGAHAVNPGKHEIVARADGYTDWSKSVRLDEGATQTLEVRMVRAGGEDDASSKGGAPRWSAYASWGVGGVALIGGAVFGVFAIQTTNEILKRKEPYDCNANLCPQAAESDLAIARMNGNLSTAGFAIAGVGAVSGLVLFLLSGDASKPAHGDDEGKGESLAASPMLGPGFIGVTGTF
ncbi:MAG: hypothetical protein EXR75_10975 [Myxococcales bacterium]|nr:hypothetical protein [Myxococcales bacterium]